MEVSHRIKSPPRPPTRQASLGPACSCQRQKLRQQGALGTGFPLMHGNTLPCCSEAAPPPHATGLQRLQPLPWQLAVQNVLHGQTPPSPDLAAHHATCSRLSHMRTAEPIRPCAGRPHGEQRASTTHPRQASVHREAAIDRRRPCGVWGPARTSQEPAAAPQLLQAARAAARVTTRRVGSS